MLLPNPVFRLDLKKGRSALRGRRRPGRHGDLPPPEGNWDRHKGIEFPLKSGGLMYASGGVIDDASGSLRIEFTPKTAAPAGALIQGWGQYDPLLGFQSDGKLRFMIYGNYLDLSVRWKPGVRYTVEASWDHRCGATLSVKRPGTVRQALRRRLTWKAFRQKYVPFSIGGMASGPRYREWSGAFEGWIGRVATYATPLDVPGPIEVSERDKPIASPFAREEGIKVLSLDDPEIRPDPLGLIQLPDRIEDLRKTRRVCGVDEVIAKAKNEIEVFSALTSWLGRMWPHCNYWPWEKGVQRDIFWKRGHELIPEIKAGRAGGMCGGYAHMMEEVFWSLGFDARRIQVTGHSSFEAHLNEQDRWVICDASANEQCHVFADRDGRLLGAGDLIRRHEALTHDPNAFGDVRRHLCRDENLVSERVYTPIGRSPQVGPSTNDLLRLYDHIGVITDKTASYGKRRSDPRGKAPAAWYYREPERAFFDPRASGFAPEDFLVKDLNHLYPSRNRAAVRLAWARRGASLCVTARPVGVTFFDSFLVSVDGAPAKSSKGDLVWPLHAGVNTLSVRTRNRLGALGYPYRIILWKRP